MNTKLPIVREIIPPSSKARKLVQNRILTQESPPLDPGVRAELMEGYREDILRLQELIGRDLSRWWKDEGEG